MMLLRGAIAAVVFAGLTVASSSYSGQQVENAKSAIEDNQQHRHFGGSHHQRPKPNALKIFCERTRAWLNTTGANVTASNGTESSIQELLVDFLTAICPDDANDRSEVQQDEEQRHGNHHNHHRRHPQNKSLETFYEEQRHGNHHNHHRRHPQNEEQRHGNHHNHHRRHPQNEEQRHGNHHNHHRRHPQNEEKRHGHHHIHHQRPSQNKSLETFYEEQRHGNHHNHHRRHPQNEEKRHGWNWGWNGNHHNPQNKPLETFCQRTENWLNTAGVNVTSSNGTTLTIEELFVDFLTTICQDDGERRQDSQEGLWKRFWGPWNDPPKPEKAFTIFCERTNEWLNTAGSNVTEGNGTETSIEELFVGFLTNICMDDDTRAEVPAKNGAPSEEKPGSRWWWNWGGNQDNSGDCLGVFCERTNNWLETAAANVASSNNGTSSNIEELFVDYLSALCSE